MIIDNFLFWIADWHNKVLRNRGLLNDENYSEKDVIFRGNLYNILTLIIFCLIGMVIKCLPEILISYLTFNILRNESGGYHSYGNLNYCLIISILLFCPLVLLAKYVRFNFIIILILSVLSIIYTFIKTPYINLEYEKETKNIWERKIDYLIIVSSFFILSFFLNSSLQTTIFFTIILIALLLNKKIIKFLSIIRILLYE